MTIYKEQLNTTTYYEFIEMNQNNEALIGQAILATNEYCKDHYYDLEDILIVKVRENLFAVTGITNEWLPVEVNSYMRLFNENKYGRDDLPFTLSLVILQN